MRTREEALGWAERYGAILGEGRHIDGFYGAYAAYLLGAPIVHVAHERGVQALGSLVLRFLLPVTALGIAALATSVDGEGSGRSVPFTVTILAIGLAPAAIDAAFIAWEPAEPASSIALRVGVDPQRSAALLAVSGAI